MPGTGPLYFCALAFVAYLRPVTSPSQCNLTETALVVSVPVATGDAYSVNEDTTLSPAAPGVLANDGDAHGDSLTAQLVTGPAHAASFTLNGNGSFSYTPAANVNGADSFTYKVTDGTYTSAPATVAITVNPVNDAPSFTKGPDQSVLRDSGPQVVNPWATGISAGPPDESGQTLAFTVTANNSGLFSAGPAISPAGVLSYTPAAGVSGIAMVTVVLKDNGGTANGGADTSGPQTFTITVDAVPVASGDSAGLLEDGVLNQAAPGVLGNDTDADHDPLTAKLITGPAQAASFTLHADGSYVYTPNANFCGSDSFTYVADDGKADSGTATVTLTVTCVNDAPSFTKGPDQTVGEDAGAQTVDPWATAVSAGPANESGQHLSFSVTNNSNPGLFSGAPEISATGALTYTPAANGSGSAMITVELKDDGGTANGGVDTSPAQTFMITVTSVNDPPSFTKGADQAVNEDAGPQTVNPWATAISPGPPDESTQTVTFLVSSDNTGLFSTQPAVSPSGVLTYTPAPNAKGVATVTVALQDNGGVLNGGTNTSAPQTFTITVNPVNDPPVGVVDRTHAVTGNVRIQVPASAGLLAGVSDVEGDALTAQVDPSIASAGDITINADGSYSYNPKPGHEGDDVVKYKVCDNGTPSACSPVRSLTLTVSDMIWFIDNNAPVGGTGRLSVPFNSISAFTAVNNGTGDNPVAGDTIFLDRNTATSYTGPLTLLNNQKVIGKGASVPVTTAAGIALAPDSDPLPGASGTSPTITTTAAGANGITLASGNTLRGVTVGNTTGAGIAGTGFGTLTVLETTVNGAG
ncbi:MAG: tandem-95 repeat protein [Pseudonocardiaceae bacterium]